MMIKNKIITTILALTLSSLAIGSNNTSQPNEENQSTEQESSKDLESEIARLKNALILLRMDLENTINSKNDIQHHDLVLNPDNLGKRSPDGSGGRALVADNNDLLVINFDNDFDAGTRIDSSLHIRKFSGKARGSDGDLNVDGNIKTKQNLKIMHGSKEWKIDHNSSDDLKFFHQNEEKVNFTNEGNVNFNGHFVVRNNGKITKRALWGACAWESGSCGKDVADAHHNIFFDRLSGECSSDRVLKGIAFERCQDDKKGMRLKIKCCELGN